MIQMLSILLSALMAYAANPEVSVNPYGKFLRGAGVEVEFATISEKNQDGLQDILLRARGSEAHEAGIDDQVIRYIAVSAGTGTNYQYVDAEGETLNRFSRRPAGSGEAFEIYFGVNTIKLKLDEKKSKAVKAADLLADFKKAKK